MIILSSFWFKLNYVQGVLILTRTANFFICTQQRNHTVLLALKSIIIHKCKEEKGITRSKLFYYYKPFTKQLLLLITVLH